MRTFFFGGCILILLQACNSFDRRNPPAIVEEPWKTHIQKDAFGFQYPAYMSAAAPLSNSESVSFESRERAVFLCVVRETRDTFRKLGYDSVNLSRYISMLELGKGEEGTLGASRPLMQKNAKVNGLNAVEIYSEPANAIQTDGVADSSSMKLLIIEGSKSFFQVFIWCRKKDYEFYRGEFDRIIRSFKEI